MTIRQLKMLDDIVARHGVTYPQALELNQNIFGSICWRKWLEWSPDTERFKVSTAGMEARDTVKDWELLRKVNNNHLAIRAARVYHPRRKLRRAA